MGIPAKSTLNAVAAHGLVTRNHVFGVPGKQVTVVRQSVCERRAVVKDEFFGVFGLALVDAGLKCAVLLPIGKHLLLQVREARAWVHTVTG